MYDPKISRRGHRRIYVEPLLVAEMNIVIVLGDYEATIIIFDIKYVDVSQDNLKYTNEEHQTLHLVPDADEKILTITYHLNQQSTHVFSMLM